MLGQQNIVFATSSITRIVQELNSKNGTSLRPRQIALLFVEKVRGLLLKEEDDSILREIGSV